MAGLTLAPALPAIHPFAVVVVLVIDEHRFGRLDQAFFRSEELIRGITYACAEARLFESAPICCTLCVIRPLSMRARRSRAIL